MTSDRALPFYDSARESRWVGLRSHLGADRSLLFRHREVFADLAVLAAAPDAAYVHGQLVAPGTDIPLAGVGVATCDGEAVTTDEFGQFSLGLPATDGEVDLRVALSAGPVVLRIPPASAAGLES
jgi:hypothetical protein